MLVELLSSLFFISNIFLILLVVMQKNYGGFWSGPSGGDSVMLFGGNQGADILQKLTWIFGFFLIFGSLSLSIYEASSSKISKFYIKEIVATTPQATEITHENQSESIKEEIPVQEKMEENKAEPSDFLEVKKDQNKYDPMIAKKNQSNTKK